MHLFSRSYGDAGSHVVILHGLFGMSDNWHSMARRLAVSCRVHTLDLRSHGRSPHDPDMSYRSLSSDVLGYLRASSIPAAFVIGHSMGGKIAMQLALDAPDRVLGLVIVDIAPRAYDDRHGRIFRAFRTFPVKTIGSRAEASRTMEELVESPAVAQFLLKNLERREDGTYGWKIDHEMLDRAYGQINQEISSGARYTGPTLYLRGGKADYVLDSDLPAIQKLFPAFKLETVSDSGHWIHAEAPEEFFRLVESFIRRYST